MPTKIMANRTDTNVANAEKVATLDSVLNVRGIEQIKDATAVTTENTMVQTPPPETVLRYSAPTKQCKPYNSVRKGCLQNNKIVWGKVPE